MLRFLAHKAGYIEFIENRSGFSNFLSLENILGFNGLNPQFDPLTEQKKKLENLITEKTSIPPYVEGRRRKIVEATDLDASQIEILKKLGRAKTSYPANSFGGNVSYQDDPNGKENFYGPLRSNSDLINHGGLEVVAKEYVVRKAVILNGPAFIKTKKFVLQQDFDALGGAVIIAEEFDLSVGQIWHPENCHLIKVKKVKLDDSEQISE